jgi:Haloacid dehalogenase-like hydrolase
MQDQASAWPRAVIFDLDGTLVDTVEDLAAVLNQTLVELGLSPHPLDAVRSMVGGGLSKLLGRALAAHAAGLDAVQQDAAAARLLELYAEKPAGQSSLYPGSAETLRDFACGRRCLRPLHQQAGRHYPRPCCRRLALAKPLAASGEHRETAEEAGSCRHPPRLDGPQRRTDRQRDGRRQCYRRAGGPGCRARRPRRAMRSAPMPSSSSPPPLPCLLGGEGNPLDISNVCHCRAGPGNLVAAVDFCVYWIARLRRQ